MLFVSLERLNVFVLPFFQVFFCVLIGAFAIGNAGPNVQNVATARGAAFTIWNLIDRVRHYKTSTTKSHRSL